MEDRFVNQSLSRVLPIFLFKIKVETFFKGLNPCHPYPNFNPERSIIMRKFLKTFLKLTSLFVSGIFMLICGSMPVSGELVQPTRTLEGGEIQTGHLSVFSEPPKMDVYLDREKIGVTPVFSHVVSSGKHILQVGDVEKEFYILSGKLQQFSVHKNRIIQIPVKTKQPQKSKVAEERPRIEKEKVESGEEKGLPSPNYFPLNPEGPIY